ncbi:hypothetical protein [Burkholderia sp. MSMB1459WGS]|uniref:hypothetical protein n=1 Tax=Burkholderia sp. MSMB1459WGS TaxID=1637970 RepID=UPI000A4D4DF2|nr:hypothetical protein [Burkholderia sp. MSMB1459WGS]
MPLLAVAAPAAATRTRATCFAHWQLKLKSDTFFDVSLFSSLCENQKKVAWLAATAA